MSRWARWGLFGTAAAWLALATVATVVRAGEPAQDKPAEQREATPAEDTTPAAPADESKTPDDGAEDTTEEAAETPPQEGEAPTEAPAVEPAPATDDTGADEPAEPPAQGDKPAEDAAEDDTADDNAAEDDSADDKTADDKTAGDNTDRRSLHADLFAAHGGSADDPKTWKGQEALAPRFGRHHTPSPLILPDQALPIRFSHNIHVEGEELECTDCHGSVTNSVRSSDVNLPEESTCFDCHEPNDAMEDPDEADPPAECSTCHPGYVADFPDGTEDFTETHLARLAPPTPEIPAPHLKFNHKTHLDKGVQCSTCHGDVGKLDLATRDNAMPTMGTCLSCHDGKQAPAECRTCHVTTPDGRIDTMSAGEPLKPAGWYMADAHDDDWLRTHKHTARQDDGYCNNCHLPKDCMDCHNGVSKPLKIHPNNWILTHPVAARKGNPSCTSCHKQQTFCVNCHQQTRVAWEPVVGGVPTGKQDLVSRGVKYHPDGWASFPPNITPQHHRFQAQRNINACAGCHTEETCLTCHNPGVYGAAAINPHPPGYGGSGLCRRQLQRNHRACVKCHTLGSAEISMCR